MLPVDPAAAGRDIPPTSATSATPAGDARRSRSPAPSSPAGKKKAKKKAVVVKGTGQRAPSTTLLPPPPPKGRANPRVFLDITVGGIKQDRIEIDLYRNEVPLAAENFRALCTKDNPVSFKGSVFHYIVPNFLCQGGKLKTSGGTPFRSIYGDEFPDVETSGRLHRALDLIMAKPVPKIPVKHTGPYPYSCGSQFFICFTTAPTFDDGHVVFGTVASGRDTLWNMSQVGSRGGAPTQVVKVVDCGQIW